MIKGVSSRIVEVGEIRKEMEGRKTEGKRKDVGEWNYVGREFV